MLISELLAKKPITEAGTSGATTSAAIATVPNPTVARSKKAIKSVNALDQNEVSLFGGPMHNKSPIIKRR